MEVLVLMRMPPIMRFMRIQAGRLAIPASLFLLFGCATTQETGPTVSAHHRMQDISVEGTPFNQVFDGHADVVVLTFFDLYCVACQQSAGNFKVLKTRLAESFPDKDIQVTGVAIGDTAFELSVFQRKYSLDYRSLPDPDKAFETPFAIRGTPTVLVFQRKADDCLEIYRHEGRFRRTDVELLLEAIQKSVSP